MTKSLLFIKIWLWTGIVLISAMVVIGGITRLTGSGLSIVEWKVVTGSIPPLNEEQWNAEFDKYKQFPEYKRVNFGMTLNEFKSIYTWEFVHRLLGRFIGVVFLVPFIVFWIKKWLSPLLFKRLIFIFGLGALQGLAGWFMVWSGLQDHPHVSHFRLATHLFLALALIGVILWTILGLEYQGIRKGGGKLQFPFVCLGLLLIQIILGAFVAGLKAGYSYNDFPWMGDSFFPSSSLVRSSPILYNGALLQFVHRWLAFLVLASIVVLYVISRREATTQYLARLLLVLTGAQVLLGTLTLLFSVPIALGVAHQFIAVVLFIITTLVVLKLRYIAI